MQSSIKGFLCGKNKMAPASLSQETGAVVLFAYVKNFTISRDARDRRDEVKSSKF
jgi:hypothetical protein